MFFMKRIKGIISGLILIGILFTAYLIFKNSFREVSSQITVPIDQIVKATLQAYDDQLINQVASNLRETLSVNPQAVEVTQPEKGAKETPLPAVGLPVEHFIWNIWGHRQYFAIGCEAAVARDWALFFGVEVHESNFQFQLPVSDNPDYGFVGSVTDPWGQVPPYSYGVHAFPVANLLRSGYGMNARGVKGFTLEQLKIEIAANRPVIAWVVGNMVGGVSYEYTDKQGRKVTVAAYEHVVIVTGYTQESIRYMNNGKFYDIPTRYFENSWQILGNMVVYLES
jgi:uncharacterized protein YvpB